MSCVCKHQDIQPLDMTEYPRMSHQVTRNSHRSCTLMVLRNRPTIETKPLYESKFIVKFVASVKVRRKGCKIVT